MKYIILAFSALLFLGCQSNANDESLTLRDGQKVQNLNLELSKAIDRMANREKQMQLNMLRVLGQPEEEAKMDSLSKQVAEKHSKEMNEILDQYGYPTDLIVGQKSSDNFFMLLERAREDKALKQKGIEKLHEAIQKGQADSLDYVVLADQYALENEEKMLFGTQVLYRDNGQAFVPNPSDSIDENRKMYGLDSLHLYLNAKTIQYFEFNKNELKSKGITAPVLY